WKVIVAFIGVFVAGAIFGGVFTLGAGKRARVEAPAPLPTPAQVVQQQTPPEPTKAGQPQKQAAKLPPIQLGMMRELTKRLSPTAEQNKAIRPIMARAAEDIQRMQRDHIQETSRTMDRMYQDISAILSPEQ